MKNFIIGKPLWFAITFTIFNFLLGFVVFIIGSIMGLSEISLQIIAVILLAIIPLAIITWLDWWKDSGFVTTTQNVPVIAIALVEAALPLAWFGITEIENQLMILILITAFLTGLGEETVSRGILMRALLPRGKWQAALIPAALFGISHITQFVFLGMSIADNLVQITNASLLGLLYAGLRLRVNNIWPLIIMHMLHNTFFTMAIGFDLGGVSAAYWAVDWVLMLIGGIFLLTRPATATIDGQPAG